VKNATLSSRVFAVTNQKTSFIAENIQKNTLSRANPSHLLPYLIEKPMLANQGNRRTIQT